MYFFILASLYAMISSIMIEYTHDDVIRQCERNIKIFLSCLHELELVDKKECEDTRDSKNNPIWLSKYNYQSLMNLLFTMQRFGPLKNYWEGSMQGEGSLKLIKPTINNLKARNWHVNTHIKLLEERVFDRILQTYTQEEIADNGMKEFQKMKYLRESRVRKMIHKYKSLYDLHVVFRRQYAINCVMMDDNQLYILIQNANKCNTVSVSLKIAYTGNIERINMNLHSVNIDQKLIDKDLKEVDEHKIKSYLVGLPINIECAKEENTNIYYFIDSNWMELNSEGIIHRPTLN